MMQSKIKVEEIAEVCFLDMEKNVSLARSPEIVFVQQFSKAYFGILALSSYLKHHGIRSDVIISTLEHDPVVKIKELNPLLVGISVLSVEHKWLVNISAMIRRALPGTTIIVGGVHAQLYSEEILKDALAVDLVCHSEGEEVLPRVLQELQKPASARDWHVIDGICFRGNDKGIVSNQRAEMVSYSDEIVEDKDIYYSRYPELFNDGVYHFFSARGCALNCSFCYVPNLRRAFKGKGDFLRSKSVDNFMEEIIRQKKKYANMKSIWFYDDYFTSDVDWMAEFLKRYKREIDIPFICTTIAVLMPEVMPAMLAEAGCRAVNFGIETGSFELRRKVLKKGITDEAIIRCGTSLTEHGIQVFASNMFCIPDETLEDAFKTIELNIEAKVKHSSAGLFLPFPNQGITDHAINRGYLKPDYSLYDMPSTFFQFSSVLTNVPDKEAIENVQRLSYFFIRWPWTFRLFKNCVRWPFLSTFFYFLCIAGNFFRHTDMVKVSFINGVRSAWARRATFNPVLFSGGGDRKKVKIDHGPKTETAVSDSRF